MTRAWTKTAIAALMLATAISAAPASAQQDTVLAQARASGVIGEQADGYLGVRTGQTASADLRARVDQLNIRRRAEYTTRAERNNATPNEMAASIVCVLFGERLRVGEYYRNEAGQWHQYTASAAVELPSWCNAARAN
jgi:uncharacterized protein YdbL (DUF1318 family)